MTGDFIMHRTSPRLLPSLALAGPLLLMLAPAVAGPTDDSAIAATAGVTGMMIPVGNCNDSGTGSLRDAVARALSGDTIDMRGLGCRKINLTSGAIAIPQDDLTLVGGGRITVDANRLSSVFRHSGTGWLRIRGMTIARGSHTSGNRDTFGGCVYSAGSIELVYSLVHWCRVTGWGSGLYAEGAVTLSDSQVLGNTAAAAVTGGSIFARSGRLTAYRSRICGNHGGGIRALSGLHVNYTTLSGNDGASIITQDYAIVANSTVSGNKSSFGNVILAGPGPNLIINSTISGNTSGHSTVSLGRKSSIVNSTIAFNQHHDSACDTHGGAVFLDVDDHSPMHIESTIVARNFCEGVPHRDIFVGEFGGSVDGANNLITSSNRPLPPDTISADPRLAPLADNGGRTRTHALLDDSPAIDTGNNAAGLAYDQRGQGFPRVKGLQADIGAYER